MKGCEAIAEAAVLGGCRFFAGYPITPQNEIPEYLSWRLPQVGGVFVQGESEVASINMVYGAAATGVRAMTSSSSPGISLKSEGVSYLSGAHLPALVVNVSRGGPGLGSIQPAQSDYLQATKALGHGGYRMMVFAPYSLQEAVDITYNAFEFSERDRNPVFLLIDGILGSFMEQVELPEMKEQPDEVSAKWRLGRKPGEERNSRMLTSIYPEAGLESMNKDMAKMVQSWQENDVQVEEYLLDDAEYVVVSYGIAARVAKEAINKLRAEGEKVGMIRPITIFPFPKASFAKLDYGRVKALIDIEMTIPAQMRDDIALEVLGRAPILEYGRSGGILLDDDGVLGAIRSIIEKEGQ
jgi:2-oxoglutarate ferredoxin oxidoreductase subunit alpha